MPNALVIYHELLTEQRKHFPKNFWKEDKLGHPKSNSAILTKHLIEEVLKWKVKDIPKKINRNVFMKHRLRSLLDVCFKGSPVLAITTVYPQKFHVWEFRCVPHRYWDSKEGKKHAKAAIKWMIEKKLKIPLKDLPKKVDGKTFKKYGLKTMLNFCFNASPFEAINYAYPNRFTEFDFPSMPASYWKGESGKKRAAKITIDLFEKKLKIPVHKIPKKVTEKTFSENGFSGMLSKGFGNSPHAVIENAYPRMFKQWEFKMGRNNMWQGKEGEKRMREAIIWLVEEKLEYDYNTAKVELSRGDFRRNGLQSVLNKFFNGSVSKALAFAYKSKTSYQ